MKERTTKNGLFGYIKTDDKGVASITGSAPDIQDYVFRKSGLQADLNRAEMFKNALKHPDKYLERKQEDLTRIGEELSQDFQREYVRVLNLGGTEEKAKKLATDFMLKQKERAISLHNVNYPTQLTENAVSTFFNIHSGGKSTLALDKKPKKTSKKSGEFETEEIKIN